MIELFHHIESISPLLVSNYVEILGIIYQKKRSEKKKGPTCEYEVLENPIEN